MNTCIGIVLGTIAGELIGQVFFKLTGVRETWTWAVLLGITTGWAVGVGMIRFSLIEKEPRRDPDYWL